MIAAQEQKYLLLDNLDIKWETTSTEIQRFRKMWNVGESVERIAEVLGRKPFEVVFMIIEQAELGEIKDRGTGIFGI